MDLMDAFRRLVLIGAAVIYLCVIGYTFAHWSTYDSVSQWGIYVLIVAGFAILGFIVREPGETLLNLLAVGVAIVIFFAFVPPF